MVSIEPLAAVLEDLAVYRKDLAHNNALDLDRIKGIVETRGASILLVDFPDACKLLDASLSSQEFSYQSLPASLRRKKDGCWVPSFFPQLWDEVINWHKYDGERDANLVFFLRQIYLLYKKLSIPCPDDNVDRAIKEFVQIENQMVPPILDWDLDHMEIRSVHLLDARQDMSLSFGMESLLRKVQSIADIIVGDFPVLDPMAVIPRHGPGAVADLKTGTDKYLFDNWPSKLATVFEEETFSKYNYAAIGAGKLRNHEPPAKLIAVPKTFKGPRLIASEPVAHQFLQQGLRRWFLENLPGTFCRMFDHRSQRKNQKLALAASGNNTGMVYATIDLSSASDRLSCRLVESIFRKRPDILKALHAVRTRWLSYEYRNGQREFLKLKKYANQGSAVTFVLQSIIYSILCLATVMEVQGVKRITRDSIYKWLEHVRVFGDDLIVPSCCRSVLTDLMAIVGLKVNETKSHSNGYFRESCGMDAYDGCDITPFYIKATSFVNTPRDLVSWIDQSNVAHSRGLWHLACWMKGEIPQSIIAKLPVSPRSPGGLYLRTSQHGCRYFGKGRWNTSLQRVEIKQLMLSNRKRKGVRAGDQDILHFHLGSDERQEPTWNDPDRASTWSWSTRMYITSKWVAAWIGRVIPF